METNANDPFTTEELIKEMLRFDAMMEFQVMIFLLVALGYLLTRIGLISGEFRAGLTDMALYVILPFNILNSFFVEMSAEILHSCGAILFASTMIQLFCYFVGTILYRKTSAEQHMVLKYATMISNSSLIGMPLAEGLYGPVGLIFTSFYLIPLRISMWSAGLSCFTVVKGKEVAKRVATHPCVIAATLGIVILIFQIRLPAPIMRTISAVSSCTTALTMILVGSILADVDLRTVVNKLTVYFTFIRLVVIPGTVLGCCLFVGAPPLVTAIATTMSGMPAGATTAILAEKYGGDSALGAKITFLSTLLSLVTIPATCVFINHIMG